MVAVAFDMPFFQSLTGAGDLTVIETAILQGSISGSGQITIASGAEASVNGFLRLEGDRVLLTDGTLDFANEFDSIQLQDSAQLQISSSGTLQLDGSQRVDTFTLSDANGDPIIPNTRIVNDGVIEKLDTAVSGSAFSSLQASNLDLNGTISVIGGELAIDPLFFETFDDQSQTNVTLADGVASFGDSSVLTGGGDGVRLFGGQHVFAPGARASGRSSLTRACWKSRTMQRPPLWRS